MQVDFKKAGSKPNQVMFLTPSRPSDMVSSDIPDISEMPRQGSSNSDKSVSKEEA